MATENSDSNNKNSGDAYQDIVVAKSGHRNLDDLEFFWLRVSASKKNVVFSTEGQQLHLKQSTCSLTGELSWS